MSVTSLAERRLLPDPDVLAAVEQILAWAMSGELRALAYVSVRPGGYVGTHWASAPEASNHALHSGVSILFARVSQSMAALGDTRDPDDAG